MALNATQLAAAIKTNLLEEKETTHAVDNPALAAFCDCVARAIVKHVTENGVVTITTAVATGAMGGGPGVPVTGSGTIA